MDTHSKPLALISLLLAFYLLLGMFVALITLFPQTVLFLPGQR